MKIRTLQNACMGIALSCWIFSAAYAGKGESDHAAIALGQGILMVLLAQALGSLRP